jgi:putative DNA primase/helicase
MSTVDDLPEIRAALAIEAAEVAERLLGPRNKAASNSRTARWGTNGSLALELTGRKRGLWVSRESGLGGDLLALIMHALHCNFSEALAWARNWTGISADPSAPRPRVAPRPEPRGPDPEELAEQAAAIARARSFARTSQPLAATAGELYLTRERGIPVPSCGWPEAVRFHARACRLIAIATLQSGEVQAVQGVRLTPEGHKAQAAPELPVKITNGRQEGALVRLPAWRTVSGGPQPLLLAEGPENGLSVWASTGFETWLVFGVGMFAKTRLPAARRVVLCRDDDMQHSPADKAVRKAVLEWRRIGSDVAVATPWDSRRGNKSDFNDCIRDGGPEAVSRRIDLALHPLPPPSGGATIAQARQTLDTAVGAFFAAAEAFDADMAKALGDLSPVHGVRISVGAGKSHSARHHAGQLVHNLRARGDRRSIVFAVPTHRLASEQEALFKELPHAGSPLRVSTWRGRAADDPATPGEKMCRDLDAVLDAQAIGLDPQSAVCRHKAKGEEEKLCPFFAECPYQAQRKERADIWLVPHELIYSRRPGAIGDIAALVVDESAWQDGLEGLGPRPIALAVDALGHADARPGDATSPDWLTLQDYRTKARRILSGMTDGALPRDAFEAAAFTAADASDARKLELLRKLEPQMRPGMSKEQRRAIVKGAEQNRIMLLRARFWRALERLLADGGPVQSGWASLATTDGENGPVRELHLKARRSVKDGWQVPTLLIDALLDINLVLPYWPQATITAEIEAEAPHQRIRQVTDRAFSKAMLNPLDEEGTAARPDVARKKGRNLRTVHAIVTREARRFPAGKVLMVAQKGAKEGLIGLGLPPNVETGHHNAVAGQDIWRDVQLLIVIGRTMPRTAAVERMAEALTGSAITPLDGQYERTTGTRFVAGRGLVACEVDRHPDPAAEAIRRQVCEGELVQIIGRGRGVNRTAANPLDVLVMTDVTLPMPIHEEIAAADLDPTLPDLMLAAGGIVFENYRHAAEACPHLWSNWEAAKKAFARPRKGTFRYEVYSHTGLSPSSAQIRRLDYQRAGRAHSPAIAWFDPLLRLDPETFLTEKLGPLAWCRVAAPEPSLADPVVSPAIAKAAHPAPKHSPAQEPLTMPANDASLPVVRIEPLRPDKVYPPIKPRTPIMPIEGLWRVSTGIRQPKVIIASLEPSVTAQGRPTTSFQPFCRGHFAPLTAPQEARQ